MSHYRQRGLVAYMARQINQLTDCDFMWWPLLRLRPQKVEVFSLRRVLLIAVVIAVASAALAAAMVTYAGDEAALSSWLVILLVLMAASLMTPALAAWAWNYRVKTISTQRENSAMTNPQINWNGVLEVAGKGNPTPPRVVKKSDEEWFEMLGAEIYHVTRKKGTERPHSSEMCRLFEPGRYSCVCCGELLFDAREKFESGTGWPSFTQPASANSVAYHVDDSHGMQRVEAVCNVCDSHLGHVFPDGPEPSGLRYCINALSLKKADE